MKNASDLTNELTRRQWLLRLGKASALAGFSGIVPDVLGSVFDDAGKTLSLPPGLYEPSDDAMVHALSHHGLVIPLPGSETEYAGIHPSSFQPQFFSREEFAIITRVTGIFLGKVDASTLSEIAQWIDLWFCSAEGVRRAATGLDPMHRALAVAYYGEESVHELERVDHGEIAHKGLLGLTNMCAEKYGNNFLMLNAQQQADLLQASAKLNPDDPLRKFVETLRNEAIRAYYTSAAGLKELDYKGNAYNPECPGCEIASEKPDA